MTQTQPQIHLYNLNYSLLNTLVNFRDITLSFSQTKIGIIGDNGIGKTTLLKLLAGELIPHRGSIQCRGTLTRCPQFYIANQQESVAEVLGISIKLQALERILAGSTALEDYELLADEWTLQEKIQQSLANFGLLTVKLTDKYQQLSGGQQTKILLIKAIFAKTDFILLDEPTNNLDIKARQQLYQFIEKTKQGLIIVSHDRHLLNHMDEILEITCKGIKLYGGNYARYQQQKAIEIEAAKQMLKAQSELLQKARKISQIRKERHEQNEAKGRHAKKAQIMAKGNYDKLAFNSAKGRSERTNRRIRLQADRKLEQREKELAIAKEKITITENIHAKLATTQVPACKIILQITDLTFTYFPNEKPIFAHFNFEIQGPKRVALIGENGSGKTTLIKLILKKLKPTQGKVYLGTHYISYFE